MCDRPNPASPVKLNKFSDSGGLSPSDTSSTCYFYQKHIDFMKLYCLLIGPGIYYWYEDVHITAI